MQAIKGFVGLGDPAEAAAASDDPLADACTLTLQQRWMGFASCFGIGMLISFLSTLQILKPLTFALLYSVRRAVESRARLGARCSRADARLSARARRHAARARARAHPRHRPARSSATWCPSWRRAS